MTARSGQPPPEQAQAEQVGYTQERPGNFPVRTCVGCKERAAKSALLRLVVAGDDIVPDPHARRPGRGAYLHPSLDCLDKARRRRALPRALRATGSPGTGPLVSYLSRTDVPGIT
ncbi:MAG TPA: YlxR family protein [Trebonia sp.]